VIISTFAKRNDSVEIAFAKDGVIGASTSDESFGDMICNAENDGPDHAHGQNLSTACIHKSTRLRPECSFDLRMTDTDLLRKTHTPEEISAISRTVPLGIGSSENVITVCGVG